MNIYLGGPMRGIPEFNFPAFFRAADKLRIEGHFVYNPAERDRERYGVDLAVGNATGDEALATREHGFDLRQALYEDLAFICKRAEVVALLPGWENSRGARAERAVAEALGIPVIILNNG